MHLGSVERRARAQEDHGNLLHLAEERDIPAAKALLASHIQQTKADLLEMLSPEKDRQSF
jgi:DNA-binding GntR family transcriptional regulator